MHEETSTPGATRSGLMRPSSVGPFDEKTARFALRSGSSGRVLLDRADDDAVLHYRPADVVVDVRVRGLGDAVRGSIVYLVVGRARVGLVPLDVGRRCPLRCVRDIKVDRDVRVRRERSAVGRAVVDRERALRRVVDRVAPLVAGGPYLKVVRRAVAELVDVSREHGVLSEAFELVRVAGLDRRAVRVVELLVPRPVENVPQSNDATQMELDVRGEVPECRAVGVVRHLVLVSRLVQRVACVPRVARLCDVRWEVVPVECDHAAVGRDALCLLDGRVAVGADCARDVRRVVAQAFVVGCVVDDARGPAAGSIELLVRVEYLAVVDDGDYDAAAVDADAADTEVCGDAVRLDRVGRLEIFEHI